MRETPNARVDRAPGVQVGGRESRHPSRVPGSDASPPNRRRARAKTARRSSRDRCSWTWTVPRRRRGRVPRRTPNARRFARRRRRAKAKSRSRPSSARASRTTRAKLSARGANPGAGGAPRVTPCRPSGATSVRTPPPRVPRARSRVRRSRRRLDPRRRGEIATIGTVDRA